MEILEATKNWANGDIMQGRIMLAAGILVAIAVVGILFTDHSMLRGMIFPLVFAALGLLAYGGYTQIGRPAHVKKFEESYAQNPQEALKREIEKQSGDDKTYSWLVYVWGAIVVLGVLGSIFISKEYWKGLALGITGMGFTLLMIDSFLHQRLIPYLSELTAQI